jgi:hypothetical protein
MLYNIYAWGFFYTNVYGDDQYNVIRINNHGRCTKSCAVRKPYSLWSLEVLLSSYLSSPIPFAATDQPGCHLLHANFHSFSKFVRCFFPGIVISPSTITSALPSLILAFEPSRGSVISSTMPSLPQYMCSCVPSLVSLTLLSSLLASPGGKNASSKTNRDCLDHSRYKSNH